jgi:hypothetical protein
MVQKAPKQARILTAASTWGPRYVRFRYRASGPAWTEEAYAAWNVLGTLIRELRALADAPEAQVAEFYRRYGPLGYGDLLKEHRGDPPDWMRLQGERPDWVVLEGEPVGWVQWQARKLDAFGRLGRAYRKEQPDGLRRVFDEGVQDEGAIWLPDRKADAIRVPWDLWGTAGNGPPSRGPELMRAARFAIQWTLRQSMAGIRIVPGDDWRAMRELRQIVIRGSLQWEIPTLLAAVYLSYFLAHTSNAVSSCDVCGTPCFVRGDGMPLTCSPQCTATLRQRRHRQLVKGGRRREQAASAR